MPGKKPAKSRLARQFLVQTEPRSPISPAFLQCNVTLTLVLGSRGAGPGVARDAAGAMHPPVLVSASDGTSAGQ